MNRTGEKKLIYFVLVTFALLLGVGIGTIITNKASANREPVADQLKIQGEGTPLTVNNKVQLSQGFSAVSQAVGPAVVNISTTSRVRARTSRGNSPVTDDLWKWFFERGMPRDRIMRSLGSGVIVDSKGFIVTNHHVVGSADTITVRLADGREFPGVVVGSDPETDLGIIKIKDDKPFPFARLGDVDKLKVGDWVMAIGSPFGLEKTITVGICSAKGRVVHSASLFSDYIQTDAAITLGNSGGPLVNMAGEVVGINTFIQTQSGGNLGIGFAVPASTIVNVYNQIVEFGKVSRGQLGVYMNTLPMTEALQKHFGLPDKKGVIVTGLSEGDSPAKDAGIEADDVVVEINGKPVDGSDSLRSAVAGMPPGTEAQVKVIRNGKEKTMTVKLNERPPLRLAQSDGQPFDLDQEEKRQKKEIGLTVNNLSAIQVRRLDLGYPGGVLVEDVKPVSLAEDAHLEPNDIIVEVDGREIVSAREFVNKIRELKSGESVVLKFIRLMGNSKSIFYTSLTKP